MNGIQNFYYADETQDGFVISVFSNQNGENTVNFPLTVPLEDPTGDNFTHYQDLSESVIIGWVKDIVSVEHQEMIETKIQEQLDGMKIVPDPVPQETPLPW